MDSQCKHLNLLLKSIQAVRLRYCSVSKGKGKCFLNERSFAYELYYQWNQLLQDPTLIISAEVTKKIEEKYAQKSMSLFEEDVKRFLPDMVLHHSNEDMEDKEQIIICEIKTKEALSKQSLKKDIKKLLAYTDTNDKAILCHPFKYGVFILLDGNRQKIKKNLKKEDFRNENISKIICVIANIEEDKVVLESDYLENILNNDNL